ncbi:MAG TPA: hypothetical protein VLF60_04325 [Candidatus Saccharimonadales bacterium]|nr:hypothetical protein [Candidatus Saccharimonadales bacterium]
MDAFEILVLILGIMLALFLLLGIVAGVYIVKVMRHVEAITQKAENAASYAESAGKTIASAMSPTLVAAAIFKQVKKTFGK